MAVASSWPDVRCEGAAEEISFKIEHVNIRINIRAVPAFTFARCNTSHDHKLFRREETESMLTSWFRIFTHELDQCPRKLL